MTVLLNAVFTVVATLAAWMAAVFAAHRRGVTIGGLPHAILGAAAAIAAIASLRGSLAPAGIAVVAVVSVSAIVDARSGSIFDPLTATLAAAALLIAFAQGTIAGALQGGASVGGALLALYFLTGRRGIGLGDVKLGAGIGAGLGAPLGLLAIAGAFVLGGACGIWLLVTHRAVRRTPLRFGPFVAAGTYLALLLPAGAR